MDPELRGTLPFSNWVWLLGAVMVVLALIWVIALLVAYRVKPAKNLGAVRTLGQLQRRRYNRQIDEIVAGFDAGTLDFKEAHFALAALIRSAATEKTGVNVESMTSKEALNYLPGWPRLAEALTWCEDETFPPGAAGEQIGRGVAFAREVVDG